MIKIVAQFFITPEHLETAINLAKELVLETRKESGCVAYDLFSDRADECHLSIIEEWTSQEALDQHAASAHYTRLVPQLNALGGKEPLAHFYSQLV